MAGVNGKKSEWCVIFVHRVVRHAMDRDFAYVVQEGFAKMIGFIYRQFVYNVSALYPSIVARSTSSLGGR